MSRRGPDGRERGVDEMVAATRERLIAEIGADNYARFAARIVFAVAVDSIECWLLPLYYTDKRRGKTTNCLGTLNEALGAREGFSIHVEKKQVKYYLKILRPLARRKTVDSCAPHNASFQAFVVTLASLQAR